MALKASTQPLSYISSLWARSPRVLYGDTRTLFVPHGSQDTSFYWHCKSFLLLLCDFFIVFSSVYADGVHMSVRWGLSFCFQLNFSASLRLPKKILLKLGLVLYLTITWGRILLTTYHVCSQPYPYLSSVNDITSPVENRYHHSLSFLLPLWPLFFFLHTSFPNDFSKSDPAQVCWSATEFRGNAVSGPPKDKARGLQQPS